MASPIGCLTTLDNSEYMEIWIRCFEVLAWVKRLRDRRSQMEQNEITDIFLATAGCEAIQKVSTMVYQRNLEEMTFKEIGMVIKRNIRPKKKLVIVEKTKFLETRRHLDESIIQFEHRLKERARYCEFKRLGIEEMTTEDELIMLRSVEGMHDPAFKHKLFETLQSFNLTVQTFIEFVQQLELIKKKKYNQQPNEILCKHCGERYITEKIFAQPSVRHAPFEKEKITPKGVQIQKKLRKLKTRKWIEEELKFSR